MQNYEVVVSKKLIENIIEILKFETDRGFNCFKNEEYIIGKLNQCINNMKEKRTRLAFSSMIDFDKDDLIICSIELLKQLRDLLMEKYNEYNLLINNECIYTNKRILSEIKNRRDEFMIGGKLTDIIRRYDDKNKNLRELINMINKNEKVILEIEHSYTCFIDRNILRIQMLTDIIQFNKDTLIIGSKLCCYELETGIHFKFMLTDIETINKTSFNGFELKFYNCPSISFLFDLKED